METRVGELHLLQFQTSTSAMDSQAAKNTISDLHRRWLMLAIVPILFLSFNSTISSAQSSVRDEVLLRVIVVNTENEAKQILEELKSGKEFGTIAKNKSIDPSAEDFGYLGKVDLATLRPELREALHGVGPDQITNIVKVPGGYAILKVLAASEGAVGQGMGANRDLPLSGKSSIKYPVDVAGQVIADLAFQKYPKPAGWEQNFKAICEIRQKSLSLLEDRIKTRVHSPEPAGSTPDNPVDLIQARYALAEAESRSIEIVQKAAPDRDAFAYLIATKYINELPKITEGKEGKTVVVPYDGASLAGATTLIKNFFAER